MARGWESKSVESQIADAESPKSRTRQTRDEIEIAATRRSIERSRSRVARELEETSSELRRETLKLALKHLDGELAKLDRQ